MRRRAACCFDAERCQARTGAESAALAGASRISISIGVPGSRGGTSLAVTVQPPVALARTESPARRALQQVPSEGQGETMKKFPV